MMKLKGFIRKKPKYVTSVHPEKSGGIPEGLYSHCPNCKGNVYKADLKTNQNVCPLCGYHYPLSIDERLALVLDKESFEAINEYTEIRDPLAFPGYKEKIRAYREKTGQQEAIVTGIGTIDGRQVMIGIMEGAFMRGSMGSIVGEKITQTIEQATAQRLPLIIFTASGGARMQEGIFSLMQMAKTSSALSRHDQLGLLYISVLTDPTMGGVTASFASLGDIILAEPGALIGFAGPRVIEQTIHQQLPEGFQKAEFLLEHGQIDNIVPRKELKSTLSLLIQLHERRDEE